MWGTVPPLRKVGVRVPPRTPVSYACVCCVVCNVVLTGLLTYNAALDRPAYQSSTLVEGGHRHFSASLANDGNHETNARKDNKACCVISRPETNPWWAVDLGRPTTIYGVVFTNRGNSGGMCLFLSEFRNVHLLFSSVHCVQG